MKHTAKVTLTILGIFFITQILGLIIINNYIDKPQLEEGNLVFKQLPLKFERPELEEKTSFIYVLGAVVFGTLIVLALIRFRQMFLWKLWFFLAVFITLNVSFVPFMAGSLATLLALGFAYFKIYRPSYYVHNFTELFIYGGLAAIFVPILSLFSVIMLLILISIYDAYAVWKSKHMVKLAKSMTESKMFAGVVVPYSIPKSSAKKGVPKRIKVKTAILGGGDIGFPLLFAGVLFKGLILTNTVLIAFAKVLIVPVFATVALGGLFYLAQKDKFYPAMPPISLGCFVALIIMKLAGFL